MSDILAIALLGSITLTCGLIIAAIAEYRRKDLIRQLHDEAERVVHRVECPWNLK